MRRGGRQSFINRFIAEDSEDSNSIYEYSRTHNYDTTSR